MSKPTSFRQPVGSPAGGEFAPKPHTDAAVELAPGGRTAFGGYELRGYKTVGNGMEGRIWSATIYRDGKPVLAVRDEGNGGDMRWTSKTTGMPHRSPELDAIRAQAAVYFLEFAALGSEDVFAETLQFSAELDKFCKKYSVSRKVAVEKHIAAGALREDERELFENPGGVPRV